MKYCVLKNQLYLAYEPLFIQFSFTLKNMLPTSKLLFEPGSSKFVYNLAKCIV